MEWNNESLKGKRTKDNPEDVQNLSKTTRYIVIDSVSL